MRIVLALLLLGHGIAHLPGFIVSWQLRTLPDLPYRTTIFGGAVDVGSAGIRLVGVAWLAVSLLFIAAAAATLMRAPWWQPAVYAAVGLSIALCIAGWPDARLGLAANAVIVLLLVVGARANWL